VRVGLEKRAVALPGVVGVDVSCGVREGVRVWVAGVVGDPEGVSDGDTETASPCAVAVEGGAKPRN
jgi:hypothetical protein